MQEHLPACVDVSVPRAFQMQTLCLLLGAHFLLTLSYSDDKVHMFSKETRQKCKLLLVKQHFMLCLSTLQNLSAVLPWGCCNELARMHAGVLDWVSAAEEDTDSS